ncbi:LysR substrate-binding domain-containing protein, partial [Vibrio parahaemolyticus]|uniref:LysR substrate-binding domain-containing protein n=1 Tax=Vibrio parahaemolyticus TaxID=670 RepID=UPI001F51E6B7
MLERSQRATAGLIQTSTDQELLVVEVSPSFASLWLVPNIDDFHRRHPNIRVKILSGNGAVKNIHGEGDLHVRCLPLSTHYENSQLLCEETLLLIGNTTLPKLTGIQAIS